MAEQIGDSACTSGLVDGKEVTRPDGRGESKSRHSVPKKSGGGKELRIRKTRDLGTRPGMIIRDVNFGRVDWLKEDEEESMLEKVHQVNEEEVHGIFATVIEKEIRSLYGLTDASRKWCCRVDKEPTKLGCQRSKHDHAVYNLRKGGDLQGQILLHVEDPLHGDQTFFAEK